jgi:hypothetical protein
MSQFWIFSIILFYIDYEIKKQGLTVKCLALACGPLFCTFCMLTCSGWLQFDVILVQALIVWLRLRAAV